MPALVDTDIPKPKNWQALESIALDALKIRWKNANLNRHGRSGQSQFGVDIYGNDDQGRFTGVQCKLTKKLTLATIKKEVAKAENFKPAIASFVLVTSADHDAPLQAAVRKLSAKRHRTGKFAVDVVFWDDLTQDLLNDPAAFTKHYPELGARVRVQAEMREQLQAEVIRLSNPVFESHSDPSFPVRAAYAHFDIRVCSPALVKPSIEPEDERRFVSLIKELFWEDAHAVAPDTPTHDRIGARHVEPNLRFDRHWMWWTKGVVGFAATLRDLWRPRHYSVPEMLIDMLRLIELAVRIAEAGYCLLVVQIDADDLIPAWDLSHQQLQGKPSATLDGVERPGSQTRAQRIEASRWVHDGSMEKLRPHANLILGRIIMQATRQLHGASVRTDDLVSSIPRVMKAYDESRKL